MNVIEIKVDGREITLDVAADCSMTDLDEDMNTIASQLAWYGRVLAAARRRAADCDANYRAWRARTAETIHTQEQRLAEHKVKSRIEGSRDFLVHKRTIAAADELVVRLDRAWSALDRKASILQSKGALLRSELRATGMHTRDVDPEDEDARRDRVAEVTRDARERRRNRHKTTS